MRNLSWHYAQNQFEARTRSSAKLANMIGADHLARLQSNNSDADIVTMAAAFDPLYQAFRAKYSETHALRGQYRAATQRVQEKFRELSGDKIDNWDIRVQVVHRSGSPEYISILPNNRKPFHRGSYEERISNLESLVLALTPYAGSTANPSPLGIVRADVQAFLDELVDLRNAQQAFEERTRAASDELETARLAMCTCLFKHTGKLIAKYSATPEYIGNFFDLENLQTDVALHDDTEDITLSLPAGQTLDAGILVSEEMDFTFSNTGAVPLRLHISTISGEECPPSAYLLPPGETVSIGYHDLGTSGSHLNITNADVSDGSVVVVVI